MSPGTLKLLFVLQLAAFSAAAQVDTEFWFAAPYAEPHQTSSPIDRVFRISSYGAAAQVTISQPANPLFRDTVINLAANSTASFNVTPLMPRVEAFPPEQKLNHGFHIRSTAPISAYYEIKESNRPSTNPEIFSLKGRNALGTSFYTPFQSFWSSTDIEGKPTYGSIDIVATEDGTVVTITPSKLLFAHQNLITFSITLEKGQVFSLRSLFSDGPNKPAGTRITSNKPIALTLKDDSLRNRDVGICADLVGDQIVPTPYIGTEYIVVRGFLNNNNDRVYVCAVENGTEVRVNGALIRTLNAGQTAEYRMTQPFAYVTLNKPAYAWHVTGTGCEVGAAILPALECRGSRAVNFVRSSAERFALLLVTRTEWKDFFVLNGQAISGARFATVPGSNGEWVAAALEFNSTQVGLNQLSSISNTEGIFQMGLINGGEATGCGYGYFSDFRAVEVELGSDVTICEGDSVVFDVSRPESTYRWQDGSTSPRFVAKTSGVYTVTVDSYFCRITDSVRVQVDPLPEVNLGNDTTICPVEPLLLDVAIPGATYRWQDGSTESTYSARSSGTYSVEVTLAGCTASDTLELEVISGRPVDLGPDTVLCPGQTLRLSATQECAVYRWQDGSTDSIYLVERPGRYFVTLQFGTVLYSDTIQVDYLNPPGDLLPADTLLCEGQDLILRLPDYPWDTIRWSDGSSNPSLEVLQGGTISVSASGPCEVSLSDEVRVSELAPPGILALGPADTLLCEGKELVLDATQEGIASYTWPDGTTTPTLTITSSGTYQVVWANGCGSVSSEPVRVRVEPCPCAIVIPNAFTPNGDGKNDFFRPLQVYCEFSFYRMQVFNRWGKEVFRTNDPLPGWDGQANGQPAPSDVYVYVIEYVLEGRKTVAKGDVTLIR